MTEQKTLREQLAILLSGLASLSPQTDEQNHYFWKGMHQYWKNNWLIKADSILSLMLKELEGARLTPEQINQTVEKSWGVSDSDAYNMQFKLVAIDTANAQLEAVKKILGKV